MKKYSLDGGSFKESFLFWMKKYLLNKSLTLSNRLVFDINKFRGLISRIEEANSLDSLRKIINGFRNVGFSNIVFYYHILKNLYEFLNLHNLDSMREVNDELIIQFLHFKSNLSNSTKKNIRIVSINFFQFIEKHNIDKHLFEIELNIRSIESSNSRAPRYLKKDSLSLILKNLETPQSRGKLNFNKARNNLILKLIILTGMRNCEVRYLKLSDIEIENNFYLITLLGKGNKFRKVAIKTSQIKNEFDAYLEFRETIFPKHLAKNFLFLSPRGNILSKNTIFSIVRNILKKNNLLAPCKNGSHMLRHSYASLVYQESNNILLLQRLLGHSSIETTRMYTHLDERELINATKYMESIF